MGDRARLAAARAPSGVDVVTPERWSRIKEIFQEALALDSDARAVFVDNACGGDAELRREVSSMLEAFDGAGSFLAIDEPVSTSRTLMMYCSQCGNRYDTSHLVCPHDGEVLAEDPTALVGATLDELYEIEALIGSGGFGTVYRAHHILLRDTVAIKVLKRELSANPELLRRFLREGRAGRQIRHENIVSVLDMRTSTEGLVYMVLEHVDGGTLRELMTDHGAFTLDETCRLLGPVAAALDAAHAQEIVHRDLKPENIMIGAGDSATVKVLDLGLAKLREMTVHAEGVSELTMPGQRMGSPHYMSPEQWGEKQRDGIAGVDARTDVYSLGVIAYEMLTGARPFHGETTWELRAAHIAEQPAAVGLPRAVGRALSKDRGDRHATAGEFVEALQRGDEPVAGRRVRIAVAALVIAAAGGTAGLWYAQRPAPAAPVVVTAPAVSWTAMSDADRIAFVDDRARAISLAMAGREYKIPPDVRLAIKRAIDRYARRVGAVDARIGHDDLGAVLARGRENAPLLRSVFEREGVPSLVGIYLPMVESEYRTNEVSSMGARGMFQILPVTGRKYGLSPDDLDDVAKSAPAAAKYMREQMNAFASDRMCVALGVAAYNLGPADIAKYLDEVVVLDQDEAETRFWSAMAGSGFQTDEKGETSRYITQFFAAAIVGENPEVFGVAGPALSKAE